MSKKGDGSPTSGRVLPSCGLPLRSVCSFTRSSTHDSSLHRDLVFYLGELTLLDAFDPFHVLNALERSVKASNSSLVAVFR
jgi:hypothetical protein